ncbi:hypothetical protein TREES_T100001076 [Tupaia chinensis]|uniref:Uncharacterized protein n=1 Tax=Tupaia chinensis TaxID=246437 RepID=L9JFY5_TUPCH|nr:hypothetical protein TREES_T100001076 [Tupaia chinensis]
MHLQLLTLSTDACGANTFPGYLIAVTATLLTCKQNFGFCLEWQGVFEKCFAGIKRNKSIKDTEVEEEEEEEELEEEEKEEEQDEEEEEEENSSLSAIILIVVSS